MAAFISECILAFARMLLLAAVALAAIFCGKKLRDKNTGKNARENEGKN